jgi:hypothetical protein
MDKRCIHRKRGSLILIFLITVGSLAIMVSGLYFVLNNATVQQAAMVAQHERQQVEQALEMIHGKVLADAMSSYVAGGASSTLSGATYLSTINTRTNWALDADMLKEAENANPGSLSLTMPDQVSYPAFSKGNTTSQTTSFVQHPLHRLNGYEAVATLSGNLYADMER